MAGWWRDFNAAPLSIRIAVCVAGAYALVQVAFAVGAWLQGQPTDASARGLWGAIAGLVVWSYATFALARLSRVPVFFTILYCFADTSTISIGVENVTSPRYAISILPAAVVAILVLPNWRRLTWFAFGRHPEEPPRTEDLFD